MKKTAYISAIISITMTSLALLMADAGEGVKMDACNAVSALMFTVSGICAAVDDRRNG